MKKILSTSILMTAINVFACWFTQENFNNAYIALYQSKFIGKCSI